MGDHRASIKIEMEFHGIKDSCDMYVNYFPDDRYGMDIRIVEFIQSVYERGMAKYQERYRQGERKRAEEAERLELKRLKEKYPEG